MHNGLPDYGVSVNLGKTLINFEISINDIRWPGSSKATIFHTAEVSLIWKHSISRRTVKERRIWVRDTAKHLNQG